jgi:hypothetical protein
MFVLSVVVCCGQGPTLGRTVFPAKSPIGEPVSNQGVGVTMANAVLRLE